MVSSAELISKCHHSFVAGIISIFSEFQSISPLRIEHNSKLYGTNLLHKIYHSDTSDYVNTGSKRNLFFIFLFKIYMLNIQNKEASELNSVINMAFWIQPWFLGFTPV